MGIDIHDETCNPDGVAATATTPDGRVFIRFIHVIYGAKLLDVHACMVENVPGLAAHPQFKANMKDVHAIGLKASDAVALGSGQHRCPRVVGGQVPHTCDHPLGPGTGRAWVRSTRSIGGHP